LALGRAGQAWAALALVLVTFIVTLIVCMFAARFSLRR